MIHVISNANRHLYESAIEQHFALRHHLFVEERGWEALRRPDGREIDNYDNEDTIYLLALEDDRVVGGHRLYPTTKSSMMSDIFPHLASVRGFPCDPTIWEWSRYFIVPDRRDGNLNLRLMAAVQEFCLGQGIEQVSAIIEMWWLPRFQDAGFVITPLGLPALVENAWTMAALIEINESTLRSLRQRTGETSVILHSEPRLQAIKCACLHMERDGIGAMAG